MERLTEKGHIYHTLDFMEDGISYFVNKLREYEDLEEQGLLLRLPCKVGDKVYCFWSTFDFEEAKVNWGIIEEEFEIAMMDDFGTSVFLTKEEAEKKLAEMKGSNNDSI